MDIGSCRREIVKSPSLRKVCTLRGYFEGQKSAPPPAGGLFEAALQKYANHAGDHGELKTTPKSSESASRVNHQERIAQLRKPGNRSSDSRYWRGLLFSGQNSGLLKQNAV